MMTGSAIGIRICPVVVKLNEETTDLELHVSFGGKKGSSNELYGEQGDAGLDFNTTTKTAYAKH